MNDLEQRILTIEERNSRVEADKAWEGSLTRRLSIAACTYICATIFLWSMGSSHIFLNALWPAIGYFLSTLTMHWVKRVWLNQRSRS